MTIWQYVFLLPDNGQTQYKVYTNQPPPAPRYDEDDFYKNISIWLVNICVMKTSGKYLNFLTPRVVMLDHMCMISDTWSETKNKLIPTNHPETGKHFWKKIKNFPAETFMCFALSDISCPQQLNRPAIAGMVLNGVEPGNFGSLNIWAGHLKICHLLSSLLWLSVIPIHGCQGCQGSTNLDILILISAFSGCIVIQWTDLHR